MKVEVESTAIDYFKGVIAGLESSIEQLNVCVNEMDDKPAVVKMEMVRICLIGLRVQRDTVNMQIENVKKTGKVDMSLAERNGY
jgi:hypothetical protein